MRSEQTNDSKGRVCTARGPRPAPRPRRLSRRQGISAVWLIIWVPLLLILSCLVIDVANVWLARVELENGLEAAALAAVDEWAEGSGSDTLLARRVGVAYACYNTVRGRRIAIGTNYDNTATGGENQNKECCITPGSPPDGNLIFGAILTDPMDGSRTFDAGEPPGCGGKGIVLLDVHGDGSAGLDTDNSWGVAFIRTLDTPSDLRIKSITIDLRAHGGIGEFSSAPALSSNVSTNWLVRDGTNTNSQPDIVGFPTLDIPNGVTGQIQFTLLPLSGPPYTQLRIDFFSDGTDDGFAPCDRFRFGIRVEKVCDKCPGKFKDDADGIGEDGVGITVEFQQGATTFTRTGRYFNSYERNCLPDASFYTDCNDPPGDLIVNPVTTSQFPGGIPNLPCRASSGAQGNTGQSWTLLSSGGGQPFAVRAQARVEVPTLWRSLFGTCLGSHCVTVKTTAFYDCESGRPSLIKLDHYVCPGP